MPRRQLWAMPPPGDPGPGAVPGVGQGDQPAETAGEAADREAVARVLRGDTEAFAPLVRRHGARLVSLCARLSGSAAVGEELAQESFARAFARLGSFREDGPVRLWLLRIAVNACRDWLKAGARRERAAAPRQDGQPGEQGGEVVEDVPSPWPDPQRVVAGRLALSELGRAVAALPPSYREAFTLFHVEGLAYEEMRAVTGARVNALKVRVHRARELLRRSLGDWLDEDGR